MHTYNNGGSPHVISAISGVSLLESFSIFSPGNYVASIALWLLQNFHLAVLPKSSRYTQFQRAGLRSLLD